MASKPRFNAGGDNNKLTLRPSPSQARRPATLGASTSTPKPGLKTRSSLTSILNREQDSPELGKEKTKAVMDASTAKPSAVGLPRATSPTKATLARRSALGTATERRQADRASTVRPAKSAVTPRSTRPIGYSPQSHAKRPSTANSTAATKGKSSPSISASENTTTTAPNSVDSVSTPIAQDQRPQLLARKSTMTAGIEQQLHEVQLVNSMLQAAMAGEGKGDEEDAFVKQADRQMAEWRTQVQEARRHDGTESVSTASDQSETAAHVGVHHELAALRQRIDQITMEHFVEREALGEKLNDERLARMEASAKAEQCSHELLNVKLQGDRDRADSSTSIQLLEEKNTDLVNQSYQLEDTIAFKDTAYNQLVNTTHSLQVSRDQQSAAATARQTATFTDQVRRYYSKIKELESAADSNMKGLGEQAAAYTQRIGDIEKQLNEVTLARDATIQSKDKKIQELESIADSNMKGLSEQAAAYSQRIGDIEKRFKEATLARDDTIQSKDKKIQELESAADANTKGLGEQAAAYTQRIGDIEKQINESTLARDAAIQRKDKEISQLQRNIEALERYRRDLEDQITHCNYRIEELQVRHNMLQEGFDAVSEDRDQLQLELGGRDEQQWLIKKQLHEASMDLERLQTSCDGKDEQLTQLQTQLKEQYIDVEQLEKALDDKAGELAKTQAVIESLQDKVRDLNECKDRDLDMQKSQLSMQHEDILSEVRSKHEIAIVRQIEIREQLTNELMKEHAHELTEIKRQHDVELKSSIDEGHHYCQDLWAKQDTLTTQLWEYMGEYERANDRNNEYKETIRRKEQEKADIEREFNDFKDVVIQSDQELALETQRKQEVELAKVKSEHSNELKACREDIKACRDDTQAANDELEGLVKQFHNYRLQDEHRGLAPKLQQAEQDVEELEARLRETESALEIALAELEQQKATNGKSRLPEDPSGLTESELPNPKDMTVSSDEVSSGIVDLPEMGQSARPQPQNGGETLPLKSLTNESPRGKSDDSLGSGILGSMAGMQEQLKQMTALNDGMTSDQERLWQRLSKYPHPYRVPWPPLETPEESEEL